MSQPIALGVFVNDQSLTSGISAPANLTMLQDYIAQVGGHAPAVVMYFQNWGSMYNTFSTKDADNAMSVGAIPEVTWQPWAGTIADPTYKLTNIINGNFDSYITAYAQAVKTWGHPLYIRLMHEMTANWYPWGTASSNPNGNTPADYVAAWRHIVTIFRNVGATNVRWMWVVNSEGTGFTPPAQDYPGDAYVDWIGFDSYNYAALSGTSKSIAQLYSQTYTDLANLSTKPMMVGETGDTEINNNKAQWLTDGFLNAIPTLFPRLRLVTYFDTVPASNSHDWRVDTSTASLAAWRQIVASPLYAGHINSARNYRWHC